MSNQRRSRHEHMPRLDAEQTSSTAGTSLAAPPTRILLLSNGHGEDAMGAILATALRDENLVVDAFPLVGTGRAYTQADIPVVGVQQVMPSGGFILEGGGGIRRDLRAGLLSLTWRQIKALRKMSSAYDRAIGVGDVYPLALNAFFLKRPFVFIPTAKSDYIRPHYGVEIALMRRTCAAVFPRDAKTAAGLAQKGVPAQYLGNLMLDALRITGVDYRAGAQWVIGILPGSRAPEAYRNTAQLLRVVGWIHELANSDMPCCLLALAGGLSPQILRESMSAGGAWQWLEATETPAAEGVVGILLHRTAQARVLVVQSRFGNVLANCDVVLGMSGTGNEQAAGMGIPVVTLPGAGPQFTKRFALDQKRLLGDALLVVENGEYAAACAVWALLQNRERRAMMGAVGKERMGEPGATRRMTAAIIALMAGYDPAAANLNGDA
ncbi:MAG TPA: hypothetical protein GXZ82_11430 [Firmicutes bacterium]|nr:hypothetical protein [Bacillota bacterium]